MAGIGVIGMDELMESIEDIMDLPDDVQEDMLNAEADVVVKAQKQKLASMGLVDTGELRDSIARSRVVTESLSKCIYIEPMGERENGVPNIEVGFIHEFGALKRHIKASKWMKSANDECADEAVEAAEKVYDNFLKEKNL